MGWVQALISLSVDNVTSLISCKETLDRASHARRKEQRALFLILSGRNSVHPYLGLHDHDAFGPRIYS